MKKAMIALLAVFYAAVFVLPVSALRILSPRPIEPFFHYTLITVEGVNVVLTNGDVFVLNDGVLQTLTATDDSLTDDDFPHNLGWFSGRRHIQTQQIRWFTRVTASPLTVHEIIFDFDDFTYTIVVVPQETWLEDIYIAERLQEQHSLNLIWRDVWISDYNTEPRLSAGYYASDEVILQLLTDSDFVPEPPEILEWPPLSSDSSEWLFQPELTMAWHWLLVTGIGGLVIGVGATSLIFALVIRNKRKQAESNNEYEQKN